MNGSYAAGRQARERGDTPDACPYGMTTAKVRSQWARRSESEISLRHWWLAGWHDKDMEMMG